VRPNQEIRTPFGKVRKNQSAAVHDNQLKTGKRPKVSKTKGNQLPPEPEGVVATGTKISKVYTSVETKKGERWEESWGKKSGPSGTKKGNAELEIERSLN